MKDASPYCIPALDAHSTVALLKAIDIAKSQTALARTLGVTQAHVWNWLNRPNAKVPPEHCSTIEANFSVMRWDLRPDDWHLIWPELLNHPEAPKLPELTKET